MDRQPHIRQCCLVPTFLLCTEKKKSIILGKAVFCATLKDTILSSALPTLESLVSVKINPHSLLVIGTSFLPAISEG